MNKNPHLILASGSPRRKEILEQIRLSFEVNVSDVDEKISECLSPQDMVEALAHRKAKAVAETCNHPCAIVIGSDTIVVLENQVLGKPKDEEDARRMLQLLQGKTHQVYTGISVIRVESGTIIHECTRHNTTHVTMQPLSSEKIDWYVQTKEPMDKAGAYGIQGFGAVLIEKIDGCYFNVVGLSVPLLAEMLEELGYGVFKPS